MKRITASLVVTSLALSACAQPIPNPYTNPNTQKTAGGATVGAVGGALLGAISGDNAKERRKNALIGAGIGALAGGLVGNYMDQQEAAFRQELAESGVKVQRLGDDIILNVPNNITFDFDKSNIKPEFILTLDDIANVLGKFPQTYVDVMGHTDSVGSNEYNQRLSERRALAVASYLSSHGVFTDRILARGMGETMPIDTNDTDYGRSQNRRVEIRISPIE